MASKVLSYAVYGLMGYLILKGIGLDFEGSASKFRSAIGDFGKGLHQGFSSDAISRSAPTLVERPRISSFAYRR